MIHYPHTCTECLSLGDFKKEGTIYDLYLCLEMNLIVVRFGNNTQDYIEADIEFFNSNPIIQEAQIRAKNLKF